MAEYIERDKAIEAVRSDPMGGLNYKRILSDIPAADVISKADMITLLEETEREVLKGINRYSTPWIMINSIFGIIKCMENMFGEKSNG
jgi:hypothetical protein